MRRPCARGITLLLARWRCRTTLPPSRRSDESPVGGVVPSAGPAPCAGPAFFWLPVWQLRPWRVVLRSTVAPALCLQAQWVSFSRKKDASRRRCALPAFRQDPQRSWPSPTRRRWRIAPMRVQATPDAAPSSRPTRNPAIGPRMPPPGLMQPRQPAAHDVHAPLSPGAPIPALKRPNPGSHR